MACQCLSLRWLQGAAEGPTAARLTVGFNMARMREAAGDVQAAAREYKVLVKLCLYTPTPGDLPFLEQLTGVDNAFDKLVASEDAVCDP